MADSDSRSFQTKEAARKKANDHFQVWEDRKTLVKREMAAESAATDAKTARLKALRLAKEAENREAAEVAAQNAPPAAPKRNKRG
jgi:hypothetical protein